MSQETNRWATYQQLLDDLELIITDQAATRQERIKAINGVITILTRLAEERGERTMKLDLGRESVKTITEGLDDWPDKRDDAP